MKNVDYSFNEYQASIIEETIFVILGIMCCIPLFMVPFFIAYTPFFERTLYKNRKNYIRD